MSDSSLSVTFSAACEATVQACEISLELDEVLNAGATAFENGETIFYRAYPADTYSCFASNGGTISVICPTKIDTITEEVTFDGKAEANLSHPLVGSFSYKWFGSALAAEAPHGKSTPNILATSGSDIITVKEAVYGVAEVTYGYSYTSISFSPVNSGKQFILVCRICEETGEEACAYQIVEVEDVVFEDVTLTINDACNSGVQVEGAQVTVDGELIDAISGPDGKIHVGLLSKGVHSIVVTAPGYVSSDADNLSNDQISVGEEE